MKLMKGMFGTLVGVALATSNLWSLDTKNFKWDGSLDLNSLKTSNEADFNNKANDARARTALRVSLGVGGQLADDVSVRINTVRVPAGVTAGQFGAVGAAASASGNTTVTQEQGLWEIQNAYVDVRDLVWGVNAKVGRQNADYGLVGYAGLYNNDALTATAVDAINLDRKFGWLSANLFLAKPNEAVANGVADGGAGDQNINILSLSGNVKDVVGSAPSIPVTVNYYHATDQNAATPTDNDNLGIYEVKAGLGLMDDAVSLGLDWASNTGQLNTGATTKTKYSGTLTALSAGYTHKETGCGVSLEYALASGDDSVADTSDKSWRDLASIVPAALPAKHYGEILGGGNLGAAGSVTQGLGSAVGVQGGGLKVLDLNVRYNPNIMDNKVGLTLDYVTAESDKQAAALTTSKKIGSEIDLAATYKKSGDVWFTLGYATFTPQSNSTVLANGLLKDSVTRLFAKAGLRF